MLNKIYYICFLVWLTLGSTFVFGNTESFYVTLANNKTEISKSFDGKHKVELSIILSKYKSRYPDEPFQTGSWWGANDHPPKIIIRDIILEVNNEHIFVSKSMIDYLGNPTRLEVGVKQGNVYFTVYGGDTSTSYIAVFTCDKNQIRRKRVDSCEFLNCIYEDTKYGPGAWDQ